MFVSQLQRGREALQCRRASRIGYRRQQPLQNERFVIIDGLGKAAPRFQPIVAVNVLEVAVDNSVARHQGA